MRTGDKQAGVLGIVKAAQVGLPRRDVLHLVEEHVSPPAGDSGIQLVVRPQNQVEFTRVDGRSRSSSKLR